MGMGRGVANVTGIRQEEGFVKKQQYKGGRRVRKARSQGPHSSLLFRAPCILSTQGFKHV